MKKVYTQQKDLFITRGVYKLYKDKRVVYIGMSTNNCMKRICDHSAEGKDFDSFRIMPHEDFSNEELLSKESSLILKYRPKYNKSLSIKKEHMLKAFHKKKVKKTVKRFNLTKWQSLYFFVLINERCHNIEYKEAFKIFCDRYDIHERYSLEIFSEICSIVSEILFNGNVDILNERAFNKLKNKQNGKD